MGIKIDWDKIQLAESITIKYKKPYPRRWAIVEYKQHYCVMEYMIYSEDLITNWTFTGWVELRHLSQDPVVIQEGFATKEEALAALPKCENRWAFAG